MGSAARTVAGPVVTGTGAASCFGLGSAALLEGIFEGRSGIRPIERSSVDQCLSAVAGELPSALATSGGAELAFALALEVTREALAQAGSDPSDQTALVLATTKGDLSGVCGPGSGLGSPGRLLTRLVGELAWRGPSLAVSCACASGLSALAQAGRMLRSGRVNEAVVVGVDVLNHFILRGFSGLLALDQVACRPFDRDRHGLSLGEAAAAIVLSNDADHGPRLVGWGESNDANHVTGPSRDGAGLALAVQRALDVANVPATDVGYVHMHGTGTRYNDAMETKGLARVFGPDIVASGTKAQTGHTLGAAGVLESVICLEALRRQVAPRNVNLTQPDPELALTVQRSDWSLRTRFAAKVAAGFGGINAALVFAS